MQIRPLTDAEVAELLQRLFNELCPVEGVTVFGDGVLKTARANICKLQVVLMTVNDQDDSSTS